jgi:hypothetical protein
MTGHPSFNFNFERGKPLTMSDWRYSMG